MSLKKDSLSKSSEKQVPTKKGKEKTRNSTVVAAPPAPDVTGQDWTNPQIHPRILEQRQKLRDKLHFLGTITETNGELRSNREHKNKCFHELYKIISILLLNGHFASFIEHRYESLIIASIDPNDPLKNANDNWHVVIEDSIAKYLDVKGQFLFPDNLFRDETRTKCSSRERDENTNMTIRSACFQGSRLIFSKEIAKCTDTKSIIYGFRCKRCSPGSAASNISYVGQTGEGATGKRSAHDRHKEHYTKILNKEQPHLPMYKHAAQDLHTSNFPIAMEMIYLPMTSSKHYYNCLNSWECFWQFFCRARVLRGGWCKKFPGDPIKATEKKKKGIKKEEKTESEQESSGEEINKENNNNSFDGEPAAPKTCEQNEKKGYRTKVSVDTQVSPSSSTIKHRTFVAESMGDKSVISLAGVGPATAKRLEKKGYDKVNKVLRIFLELKKDKTLFVEWLKDTAGANVKSAEECYQCLYDWCNNRILSV